MPAVDTRSPLTILGAAGVVLFITLLLPWYGVDLGGELRGVRGVSLSASFSAWEAFGYTDILLFLTSVAAIAAFVLARRGHEQTQNVIKAAAGLGALCTLIVVYRIINQPGPNDFITVKFGAFLGLIAVAALTYGAYKSMEEPVNVTSTPVL